MHKTVAKPKSDNNHAISIPCVNSALNNELKYESYVVWFLSSKRISAHSLARNEGGITSICSATSIASQLITSFTCSCKVDI